MKYVERSVAGRVPGYIWFLAALVVAVGLFGGRESAHAQTAGKVCGAARRDHLSDPAAQDVFDDCATAYLICGLSEAPYSGTEKYGAAVNACLDKTMEKALRGGRNSSDPATRYAYAVLHPPIYTAHDEVAGLDPGRIFRPLDAAAVTADNDTRLLLNPLRQESIGTAKRGDVLAVSEIYVGEPPNVGLWYHVQHGWAFSLRPNAGPIRLTQMSDADSARFDDIKLRAFTAPIAKPFGKYAYYGPGPSITRFPCKVFSNPVSAERKHEQPSTALPVGANVTLDDQVYNNDYSTTYSHVAYDSGGGQQSGWVDQSCIKPNMG